MQVSLLLCLFVFFGRASASKRRISSFESDEKEEIVHFKRDRIEEEQLSLEGLQSISMKQLHAAGIQFRSLLKVSKTLARNDNFKSLELILSGSLVPSERKGRFLTDIFDLAVQSKSLKVVSFLLNYDNLFYMQRCDLDLASIAILDNNFDLAEILIKTGFLVGRLHGRKSQTHPLFHAISKDSLSLVQIILENQPLLISTKDQNGRNGLFYAESAEMVQLLRVYGASLGDVDSGNETAFTFHSKQFRSSIARATLPLKRRIQMLSDQLGNASFYLLSFSTPRFNLLENAFFAAFPTLLSNHFVIMPRIKFDGENARDAGGLLRDWASGIAERLFQAPLIDAQESEVAPKLEARMFWAFGDFRSAQLKGASDDFKLFRKAPFVLNDDKLFVTNPDFDGPEEIFQFTGYFLAICLLKNISLGIRFAPSVLKRILGLHLNFDDLRDDDAQSYKSLLDLRNPEFNFDAGEIYFPSHLNLKVNRGNLEMFLSERAKGLMIRAHKNRLHDIGLAFASALNCPASALRCHFNWQELSDILFGEAEVRVADLKAGMHVNGPIRRNEKLISMFYSALDSMTQPALRKLIKFITGSENLPFGGVGALDRTILVYESVDDNFRSGTCFFNFYIPVDCETDKEFLDRLLATIFSEQGFEDRQHDNGCC